MSALHPVFAGILADVQLQPEQLRMAAYVTALKRHDFSYDFSDDYSVYCRGRDQRARLMLEAAAIDPDFAVWNQHCAAGYRRGVQK